MTRHPRNNGKVRRERKAAARIPGPSGIPHPWGNRAQRRWAAQHPQIVRLAEAAAAEQAEEVAA